MSNAVLKNILDFLKTIDPFDKLLLQEVEYIAKNIKVIYLAKDQQLELNQTEKEKYLYIIRSGAVEQINPDGSLRARLGAEDQFGFTFFADNINKNDHYKVVALQDCLFYMIPNPILMTLLQEKPEYTEFFAYQPHLRLASAFKSHTAQHNAQHSAQKSNFFYRKVIEIASKNIATVTCNMSIRETALKMRDQARSSCAVVVENENIVGIITDRDMTTRVVAEGLDNSLPIKTVMTRHPKTIDADDRVVQAIATMLRYNVRCLPVLEKGKAIGLLTASHLVNNHKTQALFLIEKIRYADSLETLVELQHERETIFKALIESQIEPTTIGLVMSMIMDAFNRRIIQFAEEKLGPPPCDYAWIAAGSQARNEIHLLSDQDSAIVMSDQATNADIGYFLHLAIIVCNGLASCGYPPCDGKFMAATPKWNRPLSRWKAYYRKWVSNPEYNKLLNITVFLEMRCIYGKRELVDELQNCLHQEIMTNPRFLSSLVRDAITTQPPLGIFNNLVLEKSGSDNPTLNIKKFALNLIIDLARIYSLSVGAKTTGTEERFEQAWQKNAMSESTYKNIIDAYHFLAKVRFIHQLQELNNGKKPNNLIDPTTFSSFERKHLKEAFKIISELQDFAKLRFMKV